jgi:hypothetical protein
MTRRDWMRAALLSALMVMLGSLPYLIGYLSQDNALRFSGLLFNSIDSNTYLAAIRQGMAGSLSFHLLYTTEPQPGMFLYMFYVALGWLTRWTGWSAIAAYHMSRVVTGLGLSLTIYAFIAAFVPRAARLTAFWLCTLAAGLGWLASLISPPTPDGVSPIDFWLMDGYTFFTELSAPHLSMAVILLLIFLLAWRRHLSSRSRVAWGVAWLCLSGLFIVHPKILPLAVSVTVFHWLLVAWRDRRVSAQEARSLVLLGLAVTPWVALYWLGQADNPTFAALITQDLTMSPPLQYYVLGYGLLWPPALLGAYYLWRRQKSHDLLLIAWPIGALSLAYYPMQIQRRMVTGLLIPLGVLAAIGLVTGVLPALHRSGWARWLELRLGYARRRTRLLALNLFIALTLPSTLYLLLSFSIAAALRSPQMFLAQDEVKAISWLQQNSGDQDVILSSYPTGNRIPALTGRRVVYGHWNLTLDYESKRAHVEHFFASDTADDERLETLNRYRVSLLYFGPEERALGDFNPAQADYLTQVYTNHNVSIYRVTPPK